MIRIAHVSDIHIRNLKYHEDYRRTFSDFYDKLETYKPDFVVNTGDTAHTKTQISPEYVELAGEFFNGCARHAQTLIILGNHDLNLMNKDRQDAVTPIVKMIGNKNVVLLKDSGPYTPYNPVTFWTLGIADPQRWPSAEEIASSKNINIGLFHGSISNCVTDSDWTMRHAEYELNIFDGLDYVLMGDIHKRQAMDQSGRVRYAGSMIQQNFGEDPEKGFLLWDIYDKEKFEVKFIPLTGARKFYTIHVDESGKLPDETQIERDSRIRISPKNQLTLVEQRELDKKIKKLYSPHDVLILPPQNTVADRRQALEHDHGIQNLRDPSVQERLVVDWLDRHGCPEGLRGEILEMNRKYQATLEQNTDSSRGTRWRINRIAWNNLFNYGEGNHIDFDNLGGLTGIFAENGKGKSSIVDVIMECLFDKITKGINRNINIINDNEDSASMIADITVDGRDYVIERFIERIKYGKNEQEWGKTACEFFTFDDAGEQVSLTAELRPGTEKEIRKRIGNFEDMMLTSLTSQVNTLDIISCKETERRKILYRFLDLDVFDSKYSLAKDESRTWYDLLDNYDENGLKSSISDHNFEMCKAESESIDLKKTLSELRERDALIIGELARLRNMLIPQDSDSNETEVRKKLASVRNVLVELQQRSKEIQVGILENESELLRLTQDGIPDDNRDQLSKIDGSIRSVDSGLAVARQALATHQNKLSDTKWKMKVLQEVPCGESFPQCKFLIDAFAARDSLDDLECQISLAQTNVTEYEERLRELTEEKRTVAKLQERFDVFKRLRSEREKKSLNLEMISVQLASSERDIERLEEELRKIESQTDTFKRNSEINAEIQKLSKERSVLTKKIETFEHENEKLIRSLGEHSSAIDKLKSDLKKYSEIREKCMAFELYLEMMGKDGLAYEILTRMIPLINDEINKILHESVDFSVKLEHDPEEQSIQLYIQYGEYRRRLIELAGGAEKMISSIAIRCALLSISNLPRSNLFIIDEGFGKLDPQNLDRLTRVFDYLKTIFEHVLVISHVDTMRDIVDNSIELSTDEKLYSHVEV